ncbi:MAG: D-aminoacyl-tRNA deacylase [Bacillota bacterium]
MRCVVQRVLSAQVYTGNERLASIQKGLLVLLGVETEDETADALYCAKKIASLRIFPDEQSLMNLSVTDVQGEVLLVSQFTLYGDCRKGNRPSFVQAARPEKANALYEQVVQTLLKMGIPVQTGRFQAEMNVSLVNWGPVTILIDSKKTF